MTLNTPKIKFSSIKDVGLLFVQKSRNKATARKILLYHDERMKLMLRELHFCLKKGTKWKVNHFRSE